MNDLIVDKDYRNWLKEIKDKVFSARIRSAFAANRELILFYYEMGASIVSKQQEMAWGNKVIDQLSEDLQKEFPGISGFSRTNLYYIKQFYEYFSVFPEPKAIMPQIDAQMQNSIVPQIGGQIINPIVPQLAGQLPWGHIKVIMGKVKEHSEALFYVQETLGNGWSRDVLSLQIKSDLYNRQGKAISNFTKTLPESQSDLAKQTLKDPYTFDFLAMTQPYNELDIEKKLVNHITKFLLELGKGFAFISRQYHLEIGGTDYYLDLLFYHVILKCYVVIELKNTKFIPEYTGKLNFYLSAVDSLIKRDNDNSTIGILLCRDKNNIEAEFALRDLNKPMGVSEFTFTEVLPEELKGSLPTIEEIEADLQQLEESGGEK